MRTVLLLTLALCGAACTSGDASDTGPTDTGSVIDMGVVDTGPPVDNGPPPDVRHDQCAHANSCITCSPTGGCGWCVNEMRCMPGGPAGSNDGLCMGTDWAFVPQDCIAMDAGADAATDAGGG
jgi:hypothetical protein